jgi:signal transduction histidine kinase
MSSPRPGPRPRRALSSLAVRLLLGFVLVSLVAVGLVALLANQVTTRQFELYVSRGQQMRAERLASFFAEYYSEKGSWEGIAALVTSLSSEGGTATHGMGMGMGRGRRGDVPFGMMAGQTDRLILADAQGTVVADSEGKLVGQTLSPQDLDRGAAVTVDKSRVGTLLVTVTGAPYDPLQVEFLSQVNRALVWAGLGAGLLAILLGFIVARQLTAPLRVLTVAAERMAEGDLAQQVNVRGADEIAELGQAFNQMATSLAQQETLRRNLMADIAHELRTPLSVIRVDLEALLDGVYEATPDRLASLQEETVLLARLVDDLRALSLAEAGQLQLKPERTSIRDLLSTAAANFAPLAEVRGIRLNWEPPADPLEADVDAQRIQQVVANLLSNALQHTTTGGTITLRAQAQADEVEIRVADTGPGIAAEDLPHVFDRFWQSDTKHTGEGSGLGLAIVRGLVQAHGGRVGVESTPGQGAVFHLTLPGGVS